MKNLLGCIGCILLLAGMFFTLLKFNSSDYLTTFVSETKPAQAPPSPSSEPPRPSTVRVVENPDGTKNCFVDFFETSTCTTELSGQFFDSSRYKEFVTYTLVQEQTFSLLDLLNDVQQRYSKWITLFVAVFSIYLINRKCWITLSSF